MKLILYLLLTLSILQACQPTGKEINRILEINNGPIIGTVDGNTGIYSFKGIPFAKAPVDSLRWRPPQPAAPWTDTLDATNFGPICMQGEPRPFSMWTQEFIAPAGNMSEDCLSLNIWTKQGPDDADRPVIVFIHGGAYTSGSGSVPIYNGENMAEKGVVFVTINYRVGIFGFLAHPQLTQESPHNTSGNYGLLDQIAALKWVQQNIEKFGGNPANVTIAGQSAGAWSVNYLVASPLAKGLFQRAIAESGGTIFPTGLGSSGNQLEEAEKNGQEVMKSLGLKDISELRHLPADSIVGVRGRFGPNIDGYVLPEPVYDLFKSGNYNNVPVLTGWNANEGLSGPPQNAAEFKKSIQERFGRYSDDILQLFPADNDSLARISQQELGILSTFGVQAWEWMKLQNETNESPVYLYHFTRDLPHTKEQRDYGAFHTGEVPYAYNTLHTSDRPWKEVDYKLENTMSSYWINFAKNGNPNGEGLPEWSPSKANEYDTMYLGTSIELKTVPSKERLQLLDKILLTRINQ